jgi:hypothetical protein
LQLEGGFKDAEHWGPYGPEAVRFRELPPQLKQMQPTGTQDEQGDEGRRRALEAATVARAEGGDWSSISRYLRESPAAGPMRPEQRRLAEELRSRDVSDARYAHGTEPVPLDAGLAGMCASLIFRAESLPRIKRKNPALSVSEQEGGVGLGLGLGRGKRYRLQAGAA